MDEPIRDAIGEPKIPTARERLKELNDSSEFPVDPQQKPTMYFNTSVQLFETAKYEASQGNNQKAYVLIMRFLDLFVTKVPKHPKYKTVPEESIQRTKKLLTPGFELAKDLKAKVLVEFQKEVDEEMGRLEYLKQKYDVESRTTTATARGQRDVVNEISNFNNALGPSAPASEVPDVSWPQFHNLAENQVFNNNSPEELGSTNGPFALPCVNRSTKPAIPRLHSYEALREVRISGDLVQQFCDAALANTKNNTETCGNLWGIREQGSYLVTHVLIPKQKGSDSYCEDLDDGSEAAEYAISRNLIQLGWIHTHPSQTAFLSSVDIHMQWGYQIMLPEAIAIVVAPKDDDVAFFRLTEFGMSYIAKCPLGTNFHNHDTTQTLFERINEIMVDSRLSSKLEDFREKGHNSM